MSHTNTNTHTQIHFSSHSIESGLDQIRQQQRSGLHLWDKGGQSTLVDLCTVYLHWKPRRCETPTLRHYTNIGAICRGGFNSLQSNDWLFSLPSLQELGQWIPSASFAPSQHQPALTTPKINITGVYFQWLQWPLKTKIPFILLMVSHSLLKQIFSTETAAS